VKDEADIVTIPDHSFVGWIKSFTVDPNDVYLRSYHPVMRWFATADWKNGDSLVVGSTLIYGWMPTRLHLSVPSSSDEQPSFPSLLKRQKEIDFDTFKSAVDWFGGSVVAASKFCHFVNPDFYPIWDSRIALLLIQRHHYYSVNSQPKYESYFRECHRIASSELGTLAVQHVSPIVGKVSTIRAIELVLFQASSSTPRSEEEPEVHPGRTRA